MKKVDELIALRKAALDAAKAMQAKAKEEERDLTDEEFAEVEAKVAEAGELKGQIEAARAEETRRQKVLGNLESEDAWSDQSQQRVTTPAALGGTAQPGNVTGGDVNVVGGEAAGQWESFGGFLVGVRDAALNPSTADGRLMAAQADPAGLNTAIDSEGGFLVPPQYSNELFKRMYDQGEILARVRKTTIEGNTFNWPFINETSRADGSRSGGVQGYWVEQGGSITASKPSVGQMSLKLKKLACLGYITEEMMEEFSGAGSLLMDAFVDELVFMTEDAIVNGTGAGQPLGLLNADCLISITKETNQTADTIWGPNVSKMYAQMFARNRKNAVWLTNQDCEPFLLSLMAEGRWGSAATSADGIPLYLPAGSALNSGEYALLMGKPVIPVEYCQTVGDIGDLILTDLSQYLLIDKGGPKTASSIHVRFSTDEQTFKTTYRCDGGPMWKSTLTPANSSNELSPIITIGART